MNDKNRNNKQNSVKSNVINANMPTRTRVNNRIRGRINQTVRRNNLRRIVNNRTRFRQNNTQNVIKVNKPKNVIQRNFNDNGKNSSIRGKDLIIPADNQLVVQSSGIYAIIPINPLYWQGTRAKNMAIQFQYYNPINISIEYVPTVSKFQKGTITIGCISNQIVNFNSIQNTLISSTSGESFSCSEFFRKTIALSSLLQQKKLLLSSDVSKESIPFYIVVHLSGVTDNNVLIAPGSFYINYNIKFFNPITETLIYKTENSKQLNQFDSTQQNITAILLEQNGKYGVGTIIDIERVNNDYVYKYNGSEVVLDESRKVTFFYSSIPGQEIIIKDIFDVSQFSHPVDSESVVLLQYSELLCVYTTAETLAIYQNVLDDPLNITVSPGCYYVVVDNDTIVPYLQNASISIMTIENSRYVYITASFKNVRFIGERNNSNNIRKFILPDKLTNNNNKISNNSKINFVDTTNNPEFLLINDIDDGQDKRRNISMPSKTKNINI